MTWETIKTFKDVTCIIVYNYGIVDFDIQMRNGHRFVFYCVWLENKKKDLLLGCLINLAFSFSSVRTALINALIGFDPYKRAQVIWEENTPISTKFNFRKKYSEPGHPALSAKSTDSKHLY